MHENAQHAQADSVRFHFLVDITVPRHLVNLYKNV